MIPSGSGALEEVSGIGGKGFFAFRNGFRENGQCTRLFNFLEKGAPTKRMSRLQRIPRREGVLAPAKGLPILYYIYSSFSVLSQPSIRISQIRQSNPSHSNAR